VVDRRYSTRHKSIDLKTRPLPISDRVDCAPFRPKPLHFPHAVVPAHRPHRPQTGHGAQPYKIPTCFSPAAYAVFRPRGDSFAEARRGRASTAPSPRSVGACLAGSGAGNGGSPKGPHAAYQPGEGVMTPDQFIKPLVIVFVVLVVFLAIRGGSRQTR